VAEVLVEPGTEVAAGDALVRFDTADLQLALQAARQQVLVQEANLDLVEAGASEQTASRADRENAQQVEQAELALEIKKTQLSQAQIQDPAKDVAAAEARIEELEARLRQNQAQSPQPEARAAQIELERAAIALDDTRDEYNKALDRPWEDQDIRDAWAKRLEGAQLDYRAAQAHADGTQAMLRAHGVGLEVIRAQLRAAQIQLEQAQDALASHAESLSMLAAEVERARSTLEHLRAWENPYRDPARAEEIEAASARLDQARVSVAQVEKQIQDATVRSPMTGTVGLVQVRAGEQVVPGQSLAYVGALSGLRVETTDLDEIDVVRVAMGQQGAVVFDALPDRVFEGTVTRISPMAEPGSGGVHYGVVLELAELDPALRWGMTAFVDLEAGDN
jgi:multidrug resistance efflux pump